jgi:hypothetical protein
LEVDEPMETGAKIAEFPRSERQTMMWMRTFLLIGSLPALALSGCSATGVITASKGAEPPVGGEGGNDTGGNTGEAGSNGGSGSGGVAMGMVGGNGGSQMTGGTTGSTPPGDARPPDQPLPVMVGKCDSLKGVNVLEDITPPAVRATKGAGYGVTSLQLDPTRAGTIYVGSDHAGLWKSTDCGSTWTKLNTGRSASIIDGGILWNLAVDPQDPKVMYISAFNSGDGDLQRSVDGGANFDTLWPKGSPVPMNAEYNTNQSFTMDPADHTHLLSTIHANCKDPTSTAANRPYNVGCLAESKDAGATWRIVKGPTNGWTEGATPLIFGATKIAYATTQNGVWYSANGGSTWEKLPVNGSSDASFVGADGYRYGGSDYGINYVSPDGHTWRRLDGSPNGFAVVGDGTRLFTAVRFPSSDQPYYTAMAADPTKWTAFKSPSMRQGAVGLRYDTDHRLLYSANQGSGLWRMVTK